MAERAPTPLPDGRYCGPVEGTGRGARATAGAPPGRRWSTRLVAAVVATLLVAGIVGASAIVVPQEGDEPTTTTAPVALSGDAGELIELLATKDEATYHARYTGRSPDASDVLLETWQRPPDIRQDSELTIEGQRARTSSFVLGAEQVRCIRLGDGPWTCQPGGPSDTDPLAAIRQRLGEVDVTARDTTIDDFTVRCFAFTVEGDANELCLTEDRGIPVLVRAGGSELRLESLDDEVDDEDLVPPAEVEGA